MRYNELWKSIPNISRKVLSQHLDELEMDGLITRTEHDAKLQRVEYQLSSKGESLLSVIDCIQDWGLHHIEGVASIHEMIQAASAGQRN